VPEARKKIAQDFSPGITETDAINIFFSSLPSSVVEEEKKN
jgi:hypothetical protein